jgi:RNA polymerase sigma-70 factor (ECF subfamily)
LENRTGIKIPPVTMLVVSNLYCHEARKSFHEFFRIQVHPHFFRRGCLRSAALVGYHLRGPSMSNLSDADELLAQRMQAGEQRALGDLFNRHRPRLRRLVQLRLDQRLQGRIDPSDVLQEAFIDASRRLKEYAANPAIPPFLWLRLLTVQRLQTLHRLQLGAKARDAGREVSLHNGPLPRADSRSLAAQLLGRLTTPSQAMMRAEIQIKMQDALNAMDPIDREILALRHFEELSNGEAAAVLGLHKAAASNRYVRALRRLKEILAPTLNLTDNSGRPA